MQVTRTSSSTSVTIQNVLQGSGSFASEYTNIFRIFLFLLCALDKPEIKYGASRDILSWTNHETEMRCEAEGVPLPDITWSHGDGKVVSFTQHNSRVSTNKLTPKDLEDFGSYECTACNLLGSTKQIITIVMLGKFDAHRGIETTTTTAAATATTPITMTMTPASKLYTTIIP